jgi:uncharacterized membrane protein
MASDYSRDISQSFQSDEAKTFLLSAYEGDHSKNASCVISQRAFKKKLLTLLIVIGALFSIVVVLLIVMLRNNERCYIPNQVYCKVQVSPNFFVSIVAIDLPILRTYSPV